MQVNKDEVIHNTEHLSQTRRCRCRNFTLTFEVLSMDSMNLDMINECFSDLLIDTDSAKYLDLYPDLLKEKAKVEPVCLKVNVKTFSMKHIYEGMQANKHKLFEGYPSIEIIYCANCKCPLYVKIANTFYVVPNLLCDEDEIPKTWPYRTDAVECIKYSKNFEILYYDEHNGDRDNPSNNSGKQPQFTIEINGNNNSAGHGLATTAGSYITSVNELDNIASFELNSSTVMKSMKRIRNTYVNARKKAIQKRCDGLAKKLDDNLKEILSDTDEAIDSIICHVRINSEMKELQPELIKSHSEPSSNSSLNITQTSGLSGTTFGDDGMLDYTPEDFNTIEKPHGLPGRTADIDAKIKIAKMGYFIRNGSEQKQKQYE